MRKQILGFMVVSSLLILSIASANAAVIVEVNDAFDYDVIKANRSITIGSLSASAEGFEIDGQHFGQGTTVNLNITS